MLENVKNILDLLTLETEKCGEGLYGTIVLPNYLSYALILALYVDTLFVNNKKFKYK